MNVFLKAEIASQYDEYYQTEFGKKVDKIEKEIVSGFLNGFPRSEMIELGCGTGFWTEYFVEQGFRVEAIDSSEAMLEIAKSKQIDAGFFLANSESLPFENERFDGVASITMMEFVDHPENVIQEMYRVLKPDGWLIVGCLNEKSVLGKTSAQDEVFRNANFLNLDNLKNLFHPFELIREKRGVFLANDYSIRDQDSELENIEAVFVGLLFQKKAI